MAWLAVEAKVELASGGRFRLLKDSGVYKPLGPYFVLPLTTFISLLLVSMPR